MANCKAGELAIIVRSTAGNEGKIVTCLYLASKREREILGYPPSNLLIWVTDTNMPSEDGDYDPLMYDDQMRPIRDQDGPDESLEWAGLPKTKEKENV